MRFPFSLAVVKGTARVLWKTWNLVFNIRLYFAISLSSYNDFAFKVVYGIPPPHLPICIAAWHHRSWAQTIAVHPWQAFPLRTLPFQSMLWRTFVLIFVKHLCHRISSYLKSFRPTDLIRDSYTLPPKYFKLPVEETLIPGSIQ